MRRELRQPRRLEKNKNTGLPQLSRVAQRPSSEVYGSRTPSLARPRLMT